MLTSRVWLILFTCGREVRVMCSRGSPFSPLLMQLSIMRACKYPRGKCSSGNIQGNLLKRSQAHCPVSTGSNGVDALKCLSKINNTHHQEGELPYLGRQPQQRMAPKSSHGCNALHSAICPSVCHCSQAPLCSGRRAARCCVRTIHPAD